MNKIIIYILTLIFIVGCATQQAYEGNKRDADELSIIAPLSPSLFRFGHPPLIIRKIDGVRPDKFKSGEFETLPGKHTIFVSIFIMKGPYSYENTPLVKMTFETEAGKKYIVDYKKNEESKLIYFVHEEDSEKIIYQVEQ